MLINLEEEDQQVINEKDMIIITERVDDVELLIAQMIKMGLPEILDRHIPRHWKQRDLSWGWTATIWLAHILTTGDHRKISVKQYVEDY